MATTPLKETRAIEWQQGRDARDAGKGREDQPYNGRPSAAAWLYGWHERDTEIAQSAPIA